MQVVEEAMCICIIYTVACHELTDRKFLTYTGLADFFLMIFMVKLNVM